ncbi:hypothetical protein [Streptomyces sp. NPDC005805]|uniref:hypothetical protein n=1 Tax=Streptomyces sp. NPDC005805 TaxID=3157068 RepID=UPI0034117C6E
MDTRAVTRVYTLIAAVLSLTAALVAAGGAFALGGPVPALLSGPFTGAAAWCGTLVIRRRVFAGLESASAQASDHGYGEGLSAAALRGVTAYESAAFPLTGPDGVTPAERTARRTIAYRICADEGLPHPVRTAAAAALEAIDTGRDPDRAREAIRALDLTIRHAPAGSRHDG